MAHYVSAHGDRARRTTGTLPSTSGDFTAAGWFYTAGLGSTYGYAFTIQGGSGQGYYLDFASDSWTLYIEDEAGRIWPGGTVGTLSANTWYHVAMTKTSTQLQGHFRTIASSTYTTGTSSSTPSSIGTTTAFCIGGDERYGSTSNYRQSRLAGWKIWTGQALTTAQLYSESLRILPVRATNIWASYDLLNNSGRDLHGAYPLTTGGTTVQDNPPIVWGSPIWVVGKPGGAASQTVTVTPGTASFSGIAATITPGAVSATVTPGTLTFAGVAATISSTVTVSATPGALSFTGIASTITPGAVSVTATLGALTFAGVAAAVSATGVITVTPATKSITGQAVTVTPGAVSVAVTPGTASFTGVQSTITPGAASVAVTPGTMSFSGVQSTITPGAISVSVTPGAATITGVAASISNSLVIAVSPVSLTLSGVQSTVTPGEATVVVTVAIMTILGITSRLGGKASWSDMGTRVYIRGSEDTFVKVRTT